MTNPALEYPALAALAAVVREGSFERAAVVLNVTPSAVSQRVKALEERTGAVLVVRGQPCTPTAVGARLCAHFDRVRLLESDVVALLPRLSSEPLSGAVTISVAVNGDSLSTWFPAAAAAFARQSDALLDLTLTGEEQTADRLRSGEVIAAVTSDPLPVQGCRTIYLGALRYVAVAESDLYDRCFGDGVNELSLACTPILRTDRHDALQARWASEILSAVHLPPTHWVPSAQGFVDLILAGLGWGMVPQLIADRYIKSGLLVALQPARVLDVNLYWQYSRLFARALHELNRAVISASRGALVRCE